MNENLYNHTFSAQIGFTCSGIINIALFGMFVVSTQAYNVSLTSIEQQFSQIEKQLISCNAKLESEQKKHERLQKEHEETGKIKVYPTF